MNLTVEFCAEDRQRLDGLVAALSAIGWALSSQAESAGAAKLDAPTVVPDPVPESPFPDPAPAPASVPVHEVSLAEFQKALTLRCSESPETKAKVRALLNQYAAAASAVPAEKRAEILAKLAEI